jgi:NAD(P)-dependent dehydrogenase (short-subunit alcohol dehydrogenase family)
MRNRRAVKSKRGREAALLLSAAGARVMVVSRSATELAALGLELVTDAQRGRAPITIRLRLELDQHAPALPIQQSLYWHQHRSALVLDQEDQEFRRLGKACVSANDMNIVGAFIKGLSWCQCYLFSTLHLHHNGALQ